MPIEPRTRKTQLPGELRSFWMLSVGLWAICVATEAFCWFVLHLHYPYNSPFTPRREVMLDFLQFWEKFSYFHTNFFFTKIPGQVWAYPAPVAAMYALIRLNHWHTLICFGLFIFLVPSVGAASLWRLSVRLGYSAGPTLAFFASAVLFSYPIWFEFKQGNIEIGVWVLVMAGVASFLYGKDYAAAGMFGIAGSMKIFPLIYLGLLISKRHYRPVFFGLAVAAISSVVSLWLLCPDMSIAWHGAQAGMALFQSKIVLHVVRREIAFDHSLFAIVKEVWQTISGNPPAHGVLTGYMAVAAVSGTVLYFVKIRFLPAINQILCLCIASILLPPVSYDYTLIHLYLSWGLLVWLSLRDAREGQTTPGLKAAFVCMAILFAPETELIYRGVSVAGQIKAVTLTSLWFIAMKYRFDPPWGASGEDSSPLKATRMGALV